MNGGVWAWLRGRRRALLVLAALFVAAIFVAAMLAATEGHFVPQVVDLYLVSQYAKAMAEGRPFQYNPGELPSTGATSLLHTILLAALYRVGATGEALIAAAILVGILLLVHSVLLADRIARELGGEREALLAGSLIVFGGPIVWSFLYGSDIALFLWLALWLLRVLLADWDAARPWRVIGVASLLALARPEGLPVAAALALAWTLRGPGKRSVFVWLPALAGLAVLSLYRALTGSWAGTSVADKALFANYGLWNGLALCADYLVDLTRGLLLGFYPASAPIGFSRGWAAHSFPPLGLVFAGLGVATAPEPMRRPLHLWLAVAAALAVALTPNVFMGVHFNRYVLWLFPTLLVLVANGIGAASRLLARGDERLDRRLFGALAALVLCLGALSTLRFAALYGEMAGGIHRREGSAARWIRANLPPGTAIANVATSIEYLTGHRNLNLHGVTSPAFFGNRMAEREAGTLESLARLPAGERPRYLLTSLALQAESELLRTLAGGPPLFQTFGFDDELLVQSIRYDAIDAARRPLLAESQAAVQGLRLVDELNVCDAQDERRHAYAWTSRVGDVELNGTARVDTYAERPDAGIVADAGRAILGSESFAVQHGEGRDLVVVMRTARAVRANVLRANGSRQVDLEIAEAGLEVHSEGAKLLRASFAPGPGWSEWVLRIPGAGLGPGRTRLTLAGRYTAFRYWFYQ